MTDGTKRRDHPKRLVVAGESGMAVAALLGAAAMFPVTPLPIGPSQLFSGKAAPKPQRIGPPKLTGKRLERLKKQAEKTR